MRFLKNLVVLFLLVLLSWWLLTRLDILPSFGDLFAPKPVLIDNSATVVKDIRPLAQLVTLSAYDEIVVDSSVNASGVTLIQPLLPVPLPIVRNTTKSIVIIGKTVTNVGVDLKELTEKDVRVSGDSVYLSLPRARVLDVILNPSDVEIFIEKGAWDNSTLANIKNRIAAKAMEHVREKGLLDQSERKATEILTRFFEAAGKKVAVTYKS